MTDPYDIRDQLEHEVDLVIDGGFCGLEATSVIDLTGPAPLILRRGSVTSATLRPPEGIIPL
ncbi:MAG: hypothetical protein CM15mP89_2050 [Gammaproteobacteria bacterium]|nr:MAG: hypothetical protein CM15mP89_2050 [Gammaproteobacteria bacterium]